MFSSLKENVSTPKLESVAEKVELVELYSVLNGLGTLFSNLYLKKN